MFAVYHDQAGNLHIVELDESRGNFKKRLTSAYCGLNKKIGEFDIIHSPTEYEAREVMSRKYK